MIVTPIFPFGFCEGVNAAVKLAEQARSEHPDSPIYVVGDLVHNDPVIARMKAEGFHILSEREKPLSEGLKSLEDGSVIVFSAHGHDPALDILAAKKKMVVYDATCHFVKDNADKIRAILAENPDNRIIYIGEKNHAESQGAVAICQERIALFAPPYDPKDLPEGIEKHPLTLIVQTTMSEQDVEKAKEVITALRADVRMLAKRCRATEHRQAAIAGPLEGVDVLVVLGSSTSNNTLKLVELAKKSHPGLDVIRANDQRELAQSDLSSYHHAAVASGASSSREDIQEVIRCLTTLN